MRALLRSYSPVKGFACGWFGKASSNVHSLLKVVAGKIANDDWMEAHGTSATRMPPSSPASTGNGESATRAAAPTRSSRSTATHLAPSLGGAIRRAKAPTSGARARTCSHPSETAAPRK